MSDVEFSGHYRSAASAAQSPIQIRQLETWKSGLQTWVLPPIMLSCTTAASNYSTYSIHGFAIQINDLMGPPL